MDNLFFPTLTFILAAIVAGMGYANGVVAFYVPAFALFVFGILFAAFAWLDYTDSQNQE